jgi:hypothetical protein
MPSLSKAEIVRRQFKGIPLRTYKDGIRLNELTKGAIESIPKITNDNGCWIPTEKSPSGNGYIQVTINGKYSLLHRIVICIYHNLNYDDKWDSRHGPKCSKACFNPEHLKSGTASENEFDKVRDGGHHHANKTHCPSCGSEYRRRITKTGPNRGEIRRWCPMCNHKGRR